jgi:hypothetical protein
MLLLPLLLLLLLLPLITARVCVERLAAWGGRVAGWCGSDRAACAACIGAAELRVSSIW